MTTVCKENQCAGCMACVDICPTNSISIKDDLVHLNANINNETCIKCNLCHNVCQQIHPATLMSTMSATQGWARNDIRSTSSSGGFATAIMKAFISNGGKVASCHLVNGDYKFQIISRIEDTESFTGSKYVKSNPIGIYRSVCEELSAGEKILFIGLPCQVSSMRNYVSLKCKKNIENLYTIDLICHGSPSIKLLRKALNEYGYDLNNIKSLYFRYNENFGLRTDVKRLTPPGVVDCYLTAFLKGGAYTENCYSCYYAQRDRVSDLTLGDSWGTDLKEEEGKGISLALAQSPQGQELLDMAKLKMLPVDYENAVKHNHQLQCPSIKSEEHDVFFSKLASGESFKKSVFAAYPKYCFKQEMKGVLSHLGIHRGGIPNRHS